MYYPRISTDYERIRVANRSMSKKQSNRAVRYALQFSKDKICIGQVQEALDCLAPWPRPKDMRQTGEKSFEHRYKNIHFPPRVCAFGHRSLPCLVNQWPSLNGTLLGATGPAIGATGPAAQTRAAGLAAVLSFHPKGVANLIGHNRAAVTTPFILFMGFRFQT